MLTSDGLSGLGWRKEVSALPHRHRNRRVANYVVGRIGIVGPKADGLETSSIARSSLAPPRSLPTRGRIAAKPEVAYLFCGRSDESVSVTSRVGGQLPPR